MAKVGLSTKAKLVGRLHSHWQLGLFKIIEEFGTSNLTLSISEQLIQLTPFVLLKYLKKTLDSLSDFRK